MNHQSNTRLLQAIETAVAERYYGPPFNETTWQEIVARHRTHIVDAASPQSFEAAVAEMLRELSPRLIRLVPLRTPAALRNSGPTPQALRASVLPGDTAYLRVSHFPGKIGIDFSNELDLLFRTQFAHAKRLIIDLRDNPGGGIGALTLMSYLTGDRLAVGFSKNRKIADQNISPAALPVFDRIPRSKLALPLLALKFHNKKSTVFLHTEGLGAKAFRGPIAILVNEHTTSTAEMVAQFAQENRLALIVGTKTPGRLTVCSTIKLSPDYKFIFPVATFVSAKGQLIEGHGVTPDVSAPSSLEDAAHDKDTQLAAAMDALGRTHI